MPRGGSKPGERRGGRKKGSINKGRLAIKERLEALGCDYVQYLSDTVNNKVSCSVCRGTGKTKFQPGGKSERFQGVRTCQSCWGSGMERLSPKERSWAAGELLQYCESKLGAIKVTGPDEGPIKHDMTVRFVKAGE